MKRHAGFSLVELLVVVAIISVVLSMMLPAIQKIREASGRLECTNNLRQLGIALHAYHDAEGVFPHAENLIDVDNSGTWDTSNPFYWNLRGYVEEGHNDGTQPVKMFLCPSRRTVGVGAKDDFGTCIGDGSIISTARIPMKMVCTTLPQIQRGDGASNTFLLAHKGLAPKDYGSPIAGPPLVPGGPPFTAFWIFDGGWGQVASGGSADATRFVTMLVRDRDANYDVPFYTSIIIMLPEPMVPCWITFTSPHENGMPVLFGDGRVVSMGYTKDYSLCTNDPSLFPQPPGMEMIKNLWDYRDGVVVNIPE